MEPCVSSKISTLHCTIDGCQCDVYRPTKANLRQCDACKHAWMVHVLEQPISTACNGNVVVSSVVTQQPVRPSTVCEMASLTLYGVKAVPIRLKILLDRLLATLNEADIDDLLRSLGWTWEDYTRGYMANIQQDGSTNGSINRWLLCNSEEDKILQNFLNITETRAIASQMISAQIDIDDRPSSAVCSETNTTTSFANILSSTNCNNNTQVGGSSLSSSLFPSSLTNNFNCDSTSNYQKFLKHQNSVINKMVQTKFASNRCTPFYAIDNYRCSSIGIPVLPSSAFSNSSDFNEYKGSDDSLMSPNSTDGASPENHCLSSMSLQATSPNASLSESVTRRSLTTPVLPASDIQASLTNRSRSANAIMTGAGASDNEEEESDQEEAEDLSMKKCNQKFVNAQKLNQSSSIGQFYSPVSLYYSKTLRNVRKTALKRLHPSSLAQLGTNPLTGKKRVQCRVCLKTFCDKGALKIHISAVHLREMHQCTVAGCNMVFSSRRSRNRHSANANPKLHTPTYRRNSLPGTNCRVISPPSAAEEYRRMIAELEEPSRNSKKSHEKQFRSASWDHHDDHFDSVSKSDTGSNVTTPTDETPRGVRKRKSDHPTKFKQVSSFGVDDRQQRKNKLNVKLDKIPSPTLDDVEHMNIDEEKSANQHLDVLDCTTYQSIEDSTTAISHLANMTQNLGRSSVSSCAPLEPPPVLSYADPLSPSHSFVTSACEDISPVGNSISSPVKTPSNSADIPIDEDNPRKCAACGKIFQNHFSVKTHYQNVHLKLMHKCTVDGCNAKFPSKRSRDRHSANQNLHRKLLSTSRDPSPTPSNVVLSGKVMNFRPEFMPGQLYPFGPSPVLPFVPGLLNPFWARMAGAPLGLPGANPFFPATSESIMMHNELINGSLNLSKKVNVEGRSANSPVSTKAEAVK